MLMVWVPRAKRSVIAAVISLVMVGVSAAPVWAQQNCPQPKGREVQPPGMPAFLQLISNAKAAKPEDLASQRGSLTTANRECSPKEVQDKFGKNISLQSCIADSARLLASLDRAFGMFEQADCAYTNITRLSRDAATTASAWEGKALNFETWGQPEAALNAWREAAKSPTPQRTRALAKALGSAGTPAAAAEADTWYSKLGLLQQANPTPEERVILREWALLRSGPLQNPQGAIEVWGRLDTAEAHSEVGRFYFNANRTDVAEREFKLVIERKNEEGASARVAEASYLLGLMTARTAGTALTWNEARKYAQDAGYSDPRYKRLTCLSLIAAGERAVLSAEGAESDACQIGMSSTAEDYLARGAYLLRRLLFLPLCESRPAAERPGCNDRRRNSVIQLANDARNAFSEGQRRPPLTTYTTPPVAFDWLAVGDTAPLADLLRAGEELAISITQANAGCTNPRLPAVGSPAYIFFGKLDLHMRNCRINQSF
jgi:tetratricopeptide (TPR) repeat protein